MEPQEALFYSIYKKYLPLVRMIARDYLIPDNDIDDVIQDVFTAFYKNYGADKPEEEIRRLLAKICKNCCLNYKRKQKVHPEFSCDPMVIQEEMITESGVTADTLTVLLKKQEYEWVANALNSLKKELADVIRLYVIEGRPMSEVAKILGVSTSACRMRLFRGRKKLRSLCRQQREAEERHEGKFPETISFREAGV